MRERLVFPAEHRLAVCAASGVALRSDKEISPESIRGWPHRQNACVPFLLRKLTGRFPR
jgi:hypothetical protein